MITIITITIMDNTKLAPHHYRLMELLLDGASQAAQRSPLQSVNLMTGQQSGEIGGPSFLPASQLVCFVYGFAAGDGGANFQLESASGRHPEPRKRCPSPGQDTDEGPGLVPAALPQSSSAPLHRRNPRLRV